MIPSAVLLFSFQNCSPVNFVCDGPCPPEIPSISAPTATPTPTPTPQPTYREETYTPGVDSKTLKNLFIVDDSTSMTLSQDWLSKGVDAMLAPLKSINSKNYGVTTSANSGAEALYDANNSLLPLSFDFSTSDIGIKFTKFQSSNNLPSGFSSPPIELLATDSETDKQTKVQELKTKFIQVGEKGSEVEAGIGNLLKILARQDSGKNFSRGDVAMVIIISDEEDQTQPYDLNVQTYKYEIQTKKFAPPGSTVYYDKRLLWLAHTEYTILADKPSYDGMPPKSGQIPHTLNDYFDPDTLGYGSDGYSLRAPESCSSLVLTKLLTKLAEPNSPYKNPSIQSCTFELTKKFAITKRNIDDGQTQPTACGDPQRPLAIYAKEFFKEDPYLPDLLGYFGIDFRKELMEGSCDFMTGDYSKPSPWVGPETISTIETYSLYNQLYKPYPASFDVNSSGAPIYLKPDNFEDFLINAIKDKLEDLFSPNGYFISFIVVDSDCKKANPNNIAQSEGTRYINLAKALGKNAQVIPICSKSDNYGKALTYGSTLIKGLVERTFDIKPDFPFTDINKVDIANSSGQRTALLSDQWHYDKSKRKLIINENILKEGDKVVVRLLTSSP